MNDFGTFEDRDDAGKRLGARLVEKYGGRDDVVVLGLPRGGVPVAYRVAEALGAPLDVMIVRKLGVPQHPELAMGAIASGGFRIFNDDVISRLGIPKSDIESVTRVERDNLQKREKRYRGERQRVDLSGKVVILVDDGLATGATMRAAITAVREQQPSKVVVAVPTGARETCEKVASAADEFVSLVQPAPFLAVGQSYKDFSPVVDSTVETLLGNPPT